ncbi:zinc-dependent alcohol dehydrogenase family protein [Pararobbsia silviterrae]|uniref:NAD(P)-dependent alcohol dehydrogenase n=1 Tax=Pararobbsia silviterrae TaxID=1792498 RepID=A0A494X2R4_9BURK|nr:NAD(P)-dependent alcohol dehydrogenase [Pararobbsia silviterrae]RKP43911.1 NAD(P)-dependent alcohol dehydrogenase [Pararobbsia silviterrae]
MRSYRLLPIGDTVAPTVTDDVVPILGPFEVLIRVRAASLNYRDLIVLDGAVNGDYDGRIPLSDAAGDVTAIGDQVTRWKVGDKVAASFFRDWLDGPFKAEYLRSAQGGSATDGVLAEYIALSETSLVAIPQHLSMEQAAALPCAAVTAWQALIARGQIEAESTVLIQGTGGVALFALQFAVAKGARVIVLSSSDEKLERAARLGASALINYKATPEWDKAVIEQTGGQGASHVLELGGPGTFERSLRALAPGGKIAQIGVLTGFGPTPNLARLQNLNADILGITVGSVSHFTAMNAFIDERRLAPIIDQIFAFEDVANAYAYLRSGHHFGKIVVRV